jgi:alcohol dehydrogenase
MSLLLKEKYKNLYKILVSYKNKKIFLLTGKKSFYKSGADQIFKEIFDKTNLIIYFKKNKIPTLEELKIINKKIDLTQPDLFLAIGGGAVLDYAKISNSISKTENGRLEKQIIDQNIKLKKKHRLIAIPTTAGSGAEVTSNAVIYIKGVKYSIEGKPILPNDFFLIPELIVKLNKNIKASSGFDAISQAIESLISTRSTPESIKFSKKSLNLSTKYFLNYYENPNIKNSLLMAEAACYSGKAINITKTTAPHAVSYPLTAHFNLSHGHAVSLTLNDFLKLNYEKAQFSQSIFDLKKRYELIFSLTKTNNINELDKYLNYLKSKVKLEQSFLKLGININKKLDLILKGVNVLRLKNNPIKLDKNDLAKVFLNKK